MNCFFCDPIQSGEYLIGQFIHLLCKARGSSLNDVSFAFSSNDGEGGDVLNGTRNELDNVEHS